MNATVERTIEPIQRRINELSDVNREYGPDEVRLLVVAELMQLLIACKEAGVEDEMPDERQMELLGDVKPEVDAALGVEG